MLNSSLQFISSSLKFDSSNLAITPLKEFCHNSHVPFSTILLPPLMRTTSPGLILLYIVVFLLISCLSLSALRYFCNHLFHTASLQEIMYFCLFRMTFSSILAGSYAIGKASSCPNTSAFGVRTGQSEVSLLYISGLLFKHCSTSSKTSSNSLNDKKDFPVDLHIDCFTVPMILSYWPPHQGARLRLNCHFISFLERYS